MEIKFYNRHTGKIERELVYGDQFIRWLYETKLGKCFAPLITGTFLSKIYGALQDIGWVSHRKIMPFVKKFQIPLTDYLPEEGRNEADPYSTFNQFFIRRFRPNKRPFVKDEKLLAAFSEARYFGYTSVSQDETIPVKGKYLNPQSLLAHKIWSETFKDGPLLLARLCPVDYHRFHYPDDGLILDEFRIPGALHSVNPLALKNKQDILITNERHVTIFETKNFGKIAYIEVGATCVGKIVQSTPLTAGSSFKKGDEKGYFLFGGSTVIVVGEKGRWTPSLDILDNTKNGLETYLHLGETVATIG